MIKDNTIKDCVFCKIVNDKISAKKILETKNVLCFLDINPIAKGHCLIIPKKHCKDIFDINTTTLKEIIETSKNVSMLARKKLGAAGVNILHASGVDAQQSVFHFHIHIVPRYKNDGLNTWPKSKYKELNLDNIQRILRDTIK